MVEHTALCHTAFRLWGETMAAYKRMWPNACAHCHGRGHLTREHGKAACACVVNNYCPQCFQRTIGAIGNRRTSDKVLGCTTCGCLADSGEPPDIPDCECGRFHKSPETPTQRIDDVPTA